MYSKLKNDITAVFYHIRFQYLYSIYTNIKMWVFHRKTTIDELNPKYRYVLSPTVTVAKQALLSGLVDMHSP